MWRRIFSGKDDGLNGQIFKKEFLKTEKGVLLDVRTAAEFYEGTIPGAINIDYLSKDFNRKIKFLDPDKTYFVFCRNGNRSHAACKVMKKYGLKAYKLRNGIDSWPG